LRSASFLESRETRGGGAAKAPAARRSALLDLPHLNDSSDPRNVYPAYWAPFVALAPP
jgi:hypothetical protein